MSDEIKVGVRIDADASGAQTGVKQAEAAFEGLGVESSRVLQQAAEAAAQSFAAIRHSATATAEDIDASFAVMAEAELKAAQAVGDARAEQVAEALKQNAETEEQLASVIQLEKKYVASIRDTADAYKTLGVESTASLEEAAIAARAALDTLKTSGTATAADLNAAFSAVAEAELKVAAAAGEAEVKVVSAALKEKAATEQQKLALAQLTEEYRAVASGADAAARASGGFGSTLKQASKYLLVYGGMASLFFGIKNALEAVFTTGAKFQVFQEQLTSAFGSAEQGKIIFQQLQAVAKTTPLQLTDVVNAAIKLKNFGLDPLDGSLQAVIDQSAKLGGGTQTLNSVILALGQAFAKGRLQIQEILQLVNAGVLSFDLLTKATGKTTAQILQLSQTGQLGRDVIQKLIAEMEKQASGAAADQLKTLSGQVSNLKDNYSEFLNKVSQYGPLQLATKTIKGLNKIFSDTGNTAKTTGRTIFEVGEVILGIGDSLKAQFDSLKLVFQGVGAFISETLAGIAYGISLVTFGHMSDNFAATAKELRKKAADLVDDAAGSASKIRTDYSDAFTHFGAVADDTYAQMTKGADKSADAAKKAAAARAKATQKAAKAQAEALTELQQHLKALGLNYETVTRGITINGQKAIDAITAIGSNAQTTAKVMQAAFDGALSKATTKEDAEALIVAIGNVRVSGFDAAAAIQEIKARLDELPAAAAAVDPVDAALKRLGVDGESALSRLAKQATDDFNTIANSGTQSANVVAAAYAKMAAAQLKAAQAAGAAQLQTTADSLQSQASTRQESVALAKLTSQYPALSDASKKAGSIQVASAVAAKSANAELVKEIQKSTSIDQLNQVRDKLRDAYAAGKIGATEYAADVKAAKQQEDALARAAQGMAAALANAITSARAQFADMGKAALAAFDDVERGATVYGESVETFIDKYSDGVTALLEKSKEETARANELTAALSETSGQTLLNVQQAQDAARAFQYLDSQTLSNLNSAITTAKQNLDGLRQSADQTLIDLQNQLDQINGNTLAVEQRANATKRANIEAQLQTARQAGDRKSITELQQSLELLRKIGAAQTQQAQQQTATTPPPAAPPSSGAYDLNLTINGQNLGSVQASSEAQAQQIIQALQAAQSTSTVR